MRRWGLAACAMPVLVTMTSAIFWVGCDLVAFDASMHTRYDVPVPKVARPSDADVVARGKPLTLAVRNIAWLPAPNTADVERLESREYGALLSQACTMCHGANLSGGAIPGAPSSVPIPSNLTPHASGLKTWSYSDFDRLLTTRVRKNGKTLDPFMPTEVFAKYDDRQKRALWAHLQSIPPRPFGQR